MSSSLFTVAGAVFLSLSLPSPPPDLRIYAFKAFLNQTHDLTSFRDPRKTASLRKRIALVDRGWAGPYNNNALAQLVASGKDAEATLFDASRAEQEGYALEEMARLVSTDEDIAMDFSTDASSVAWFLKPPDTPDLRDTRSVRPSTYPATKTCVRTSCELVVEIYFTNAPPGSKPKLLIAQLLKKTVFLNRYVHLIICIHMTRHQTD